jgi:hypothetical protein
MPRITYKTIIVRQVEQLSIAANLLEFVLDTDSRGDSVEGRLKFEPGDEEDEHLAPLEIKFCETVYPVLPTTRYLASRDQLSRSYYLLMRLISNWIYEMTDDKSDSFFRICQLFEPLHYLLNL